MYGAVGFSQDSPGPHIRELPLNACSRLILVPTISPSTADIVAFGSSGVKILRNSFNARPTLASVSFGSNESAGGWAVERHVRVLADTTGDGYRDIVGFGDDGVVVAISNRNNTFQNPKLAISNFSYSVGGWRVEKHLRFMVDLRKTGKADIVGFGDAGVQVSLNLGNGFFAPPKLAIDNFGYERGGWRIDRHLRFLADVTGDGLLDIVGFVEQFVFVAQNNGDGTFKPAKAVLQSFCAASGSSLWSVNQHPRFVADLTGDGKVDLVGFAGDGVDVALNNGDGTFQVAKKVVDGIFGYAAAGWTVENHPRFIADLTGDGKGDIIGFGESEVYVTFNKGDGTFGESGKLPTLNHFTYGAGGWQVDKHPRFLVRVDLTGNGCADVIGFGDKEVFVSYNDGKGGFGATYKLTEDFACNECDWSPEKTIRYVTNLKV